MTVRPVVASAPGKLILMGEHAVVYGCPALVAAVGMRVRSSVGPGQGRGVSLDLPAFEHRERVSWRELSSYGARVRRAWLKDSEDPASAGFSRPGGGPGHLVKVALSEVCLRLGFEDGPSLVVRVESEVPVGAGFGSSAATAVSVVAATLAALGESPDDRTVDELALEVERRQHGNPSGVDHRTVIAGGFLRFDRAEDGIWRWQPRTVENRAAERMAVFDTGRPAESTGEVVAAVARRRAENPDGFAALLDTMATAVRRFDDGLGRAGGDPSLLGRAIREYEGSLEELGVVPSSVRRAIRAVEERSAAAKISGAGALSDRGAGCLLVHCDHQDPGEWPELAGFRRYRVELGVEGLTLAGG